MAVQWQWKEPGGTVTIRKEDGSEITQNWYEGNCLMIVLNEWEEKGENYYSLAWFFADVPHAKNCLGIEKGKENIFDPDKIVMVTINRQFCHKWKELTDVLTKAYPEIVITLNNQPQ